MEQAMELKDNKKNVLVVDDDSTMLRTLRLWLSDKYTIYMANSGERALKMLETYDVDLVLLDYEMPEQDGPEVLRQIRNNPDTKEMPVMFLTARNDKESEDAVRDLHPVNYLTKTMPPDELLKSIDAFFVA